MAEIRPRLNESERKVLTKALALALKQEKGQGLSDAERELVASIRERLQHPGAAKRGQAPTKEDYPTRGEGRKADDEIASFIKKEYHATKVGKIGTGKRMDFWCVVSKWKGGERLLLLTVNPETKYVGGLYSLPYEVIKGLEEFISQQIEIGAQEEV